MKAALLLLMVFISARSGAQCIYTWERALEDSTSVVERHVAIGIIPGPDGYLVAARMLDSLIAVVKQQQLSGPYSINIRDSARFLAHDPNTADYIDTIKLSEIDDKGNLLFSRDFKLFHIKGKDLVHYATRKYLFGTDSIEIHQFEYCDKEWNEDLPQNRIFYTKEYGAIYESYGTAGDPLTTDYHLTYNTCLSKEKNDKAKQLQAIMDRQ